MSQYLGLAANPGGEVGGDFDLSGEVLEDGEDGEGEVDLAGLEHGELVGESRAPDEVQLSCEVNLTPAIASVSMCLARSNTTLALK